MAGAAPQTDPCAKLCRDCLRACKQGPTLIVVFCPRYRSPAAPLRLDPPAPRAAR